MTDAVLVVYFERLARLKIDRFSVRRCQLDKNCPSNIVIHDFSPKIRLRDHKRSPCNSHIPVPIYFKTIIHDRLHRIDLKVEALNNVMVNLLYV